MCQPGILPTNYLKVIKRDEYSEVDLNSRLVLFQAYVHDSYFGQQKVKS